MLFRLFRLCATLLVAVTLGLFLLVVGASTMLSWATPNPKELSLTPMAYDRSSNTAVGILLNATGESGTVTVLTINSRNGRRSTQTVAFTNQPMQSVEFSTPSFSNKQELKTTLLFAKPTISNWFKVS